MPQPKLTSTTAVREKKITFDRENDVDEKNWKTRRQTVLNRLWDSLPPETQVLSDSENKDSDSDATASGLDENEEEILSHGIVEISSAFTRKKKRSKFQSSSNAKKNRIPADSELNPVIDDGESWEMNFDFIQSIIWLKSTTAKLQRVPADEFLKVFKNQWELSQKLKGNELSTKKKVENQYSRDDVIPESEDESETLSPESSQVVTVKKPTIINVEVLDSIGNSTYVDSGFNSEKTESTEATNSGSITENIDSVKNMSLNYENGVKDRPKLLASTKSFGSMKPNNPFRKFDSVETAQGITIKRKIDSYLKTKSEKRPCRVSIPSTKLDYVLRSSECNELLVNSVKSILKALENDENKFSNVRNNWQGSVQKEAIDAIVSVVDQLEKERGSNLCRNQVIESVKRVLKNILHSNKVDKQTNWEHHRLVILELCNSSSVCKEIVNYLIFQLKGLIPVVKQTNEKTMEKSIEVMEKSSILFHSLKIVLNKYKSFGSSPVMVAAELNAVEKIPEVTDLWKRSWRPNENESADIFVTGLERLESSSKNPKEVWIRVLEELVVASTTVWPLVKVLAWQCLVVLGKLPKNSAARDG